MLRVNTEGDKDVVALTSPGPHATVDPRQTLEVVPGVRVLRTSEKLNVAVKIERPHDITVFGSEVRIGG